MTQDVLRITVSVSCSFSEANDLSREDGRRINHALIASLLSISKHGGKGIMNEWGGGLSNHGVTEFGMGWAGVGKQERAGERERERQERRDREEREIRERGRREREREEMERKKQEKTESEREKRQKRWKEKRQTTEWEGEGRDREDTERRQTVREKR